MLPADSFKLKARSEANSDKLEATITVEQSLTLPKVLPPVRIKLHSLKQELSQIQTQKIQRKIYTGSGQSKSIESRFLKSHIFTK